MITVDQLPEAAVDAARIAMAEALARDGDGIPEAIVAAINAWSGAVKGCRADNGQPWIKLPVAEGGND